jgi:choline dehydrogenase-like flavoprotein
MAANTLTKQGVNCLMLDAGPLVDFNRVRQTKQAYELPYHGFGEPGRLPHVVQASEFNANQWVDEKEVPYTHDPNKPFNWVRVRMIGGKSLFWARMSFRLSDYEFKAKDHDGFGENWPIDHAELAPFYSRVEPIFRVSGRKEGLKQLPDGEFIEDTSTWSESMNKFIAVSKRREIAVTKCGVLSGAASSRVHTISCFRKPWRRGSSPSFPTRWFAISRWIRTRAW